MTGLTRYRALPTEDQLEETIRDKVEALGGRCFHVQDSRRLNVVDMPDLLLVTPETEERRGVLGLIELKSQRRAVTEGQLHVLEMIAASSVMVSGIVRPRPRPGEFTLDDLLEVLDGRR